MRVGEDKKGGTRRLRTRNGWETVKGKGRKSEPEKKEERKG